MFIVAVGIDQMMHNYRVQKHNEQAEIYWQDYLANKEQRDALDRSMGVPTLEERVRKS